MKLLLVFGLCVATTLAVPLGQSKPITLKDLYSTTLPSSRIIGGNPAAVGQFPWQVAVFFVVGGSTYFCGGSIISNQWVLTAAHCAQGASQFTLYLGGITLDDGESGRISQYTSTAIVHEGYNTNNLNNDIALIQLSQPITFNDRIQPVRLPQRSNVVGAGVSVTVSGFGRTSDDLPYISNILNYVGLTTITNTQCAGVYGSQVVIYSTICAVGNPYHSTCNGDSGGPLVLFDANGEATQIGIVSFVSSAGCGSGYPSGYVRTEAFLDWIAARTGLDI